MSKFAMACSIPTLHGIPMYQEHIIVINFALVCMYMDAKCIQALHNINNKGEFTLSSKMLYYVVPFVTSILPPSLHLCNHGGNDISIRLDAKIQILIPLTQTHT